MRASHDARLFLFPAKIINLFLRLVFFSVLVFFLSPTLAAQDIRVGMSAAFSGLNAELGLSMRAGIELAFSELNKKGGIGGRKLRLISKDDAYEPLRAARNVVELIKKEQVIAIVGNTGTPTAVLTVPIANEHKMIMLGAYTGAGLLRKEPPDCCIFNYRASYREETALMINYLLDRGIKAEEIAFFSQHDSYGDAGYKGAVEQLHKRVYLQTEQLVHGRYQRNTLNVEQAVADLLMAEIEPKAVIMVGSYAAAGKFIKLAREDIPNLLFLNISFTGSESLLKILGKEADGVFFTQVVPSLASDLPIVRSYLNQHFSGKPNFIALEGYIVAKIFIEAQIGRAHV